MAIDFINDIVNTYFPDLVTDDTDFQAPGKFGLNPLLGTNHTTGSHIISMGSSYAVGDTVTFSGVTHTDSPTVLRVNQIIGPYNVLSTSTVNTAGTGYAHNDTITLAATDPDVSAVLRVQTVNGGGGVLTFTVQTAGSYAAMADTLIQASTSGSGTGFILDFAMGGSIYDYSTTNFGYYTAVPSNPISTTTSGDGTGATFGSDWTDAPGQRVLTLIEVVRSYLENIPSIQEAKVVNKVLSHMISNMKFGSRAWDGAATSEHAKNKAIAFLAGDQLPADIFYDPEVGNLNDLGCAGFVGTRFLQSANGALNTILPSTSSYGLLSFFYTCQGRPTSTEHIDMFNVYNATTKAMGVNLSFGPTTYTLNLSDETMQVSSAVPINKGTGYHVGDTITLAGGTQTTRAVLTVSAVSGNVITAVTVSNPGNYTVAPSPATQFTAVGGGTGATFTVTMIPNSTRRATFVSSVAPAYGDAKWHHVLLIWNTSVSPNQLSAFIDGAAASFPLISGGSASFATPYQNQTVDIGHSAATTNNFYLGTYSGTGSNGTTSAAAIGEFFFDPIPNGQNGYGASIIGANSSNVLGNTIALTRTVAVPRFAGEALSKPLLSQSYVYIPNQIGFDGHDVLGRIPAIYCHGLPNQFSLNNGAGKSFTQVNGNLVPGATIAGDMWIRPLFFGPGSLPGNFEDPSATGSNSSRASLFDGQSTYTLASATPGGYLTSNEFPGTMTSSQGMVSFWCNFPSPLPAGTNPNILGMYDVNGIHYDLVDIALTDAGDGTTALYPTLQFSGNNGDGSDSVFARWTGAVPQNGKWHNIMMAWDLGTNPIKLACYIDGTAQTLPTLNANSGPYAFWYEWGNEVLLLGALVGPIDTALTDYTNYVYISTWNLPNVNWTSPPLALPAYPPSLGWDHVYQTVDWTPMGGGIFSGGEAGNADYDANFTTFSGNSFTITGTTSINVIFGLDVFYNLKCVSTTTKGDVRYGYFPHVPPSGQVDSGAMTVTYFQIGLRDGSGTIYGGAVQLGTGQDKFLSEFSVTIPVSGSITLTPVYRYQIQVVKNEGYNPDYLCTDVTTGTINVRMSTVLNAYPHGLRITGFTKAPVTIRAGNMTNVDLATSYKGAMAEVYYNMSAYDFITALQSATTRAKFATAYNGLYTAEVVNLLETIPLSVFGPTNLPNIYLQGAPDEFLVNYSHVTSTYNHNIFAMDTRLSTSKFVISQGNDTISLSLTDPEPLGVS